MMACAPPCWRRLRRCRWRWGRTSISNRRGGNKSSVLCYRLQADFFGESELEIVALRECDSGDNARTSGQHQPFAKHSGVGWLDAAFCRLKWRISPLSTVGPGFGAVPTNGTETTIRLQPIVKHIRHAPTTNYFCW